MSRRLAEGVHGDVAAEPGPVVDAVIALGANLGDRSATISSAFAALGRLPMSSDLRTSEPVESVALTVDGPDEHAPAYLNAVGIIRTRLAPHILLSYLHGIEKDHGRERAEKWGDRTLDLDLISYAELRSDDPALLLPHPRAAEREFVLAPWYSLDPDAELPGRGRIDVLLERLRGEA